MAKRYYWLKLNENFFERDEIKVIENSSNGKDYIIFYLKLLLKSISSEGKLKFRNVIPYTPDMLSSITGTNIDTVRVAIKMFTDLGLMEVWDDGTIFMMETQNMIGSETEWAKKKREYRSKIENTEIEGQSPQLVLDKKDEVRQEKEREKDIDIDIDNKRESKEENSSLSNQGIELCKYWQELKPNESITKDLTTLKTFIQEYGLDWTKDAMQITAQKKNRFIPSYIAKILKNWATEGKEEIHGQNTDTSPKKNNAGCKYDFNKLDSNE
jgi:predicted phage replisome organizer